MKKYYPILLGKAGELQALKHLEHPVKEEICPIFQILSELLLQNVFAKKPKGAPKGPKTLVGTTYDPKTENIFKKEWSFEGNRLILDVSLCENIATDLPSIERLFNSLKAGKVNVIPAIQENSPDGYKNFVKAFCKAGNSPVCVRISNYSGGFTDSNKVVNEIISYLGIKPVNVIVCVDLGYIESHNYGISENVALTTIESFDPTIKWHDFILASGSFPVDLSQFIIGKLEKIPRLEWRLWNKLRTKKEQLKYGDYGIKNPHYVKLPGNVAGSISIRYSAKDDFIALRGRKADKVAGVGFEQYIAHCKKLVVDSDYSGRKFSFGDVIIHEVSKKNMPKVGEKADAGNQPNWVRNSQNHHMTLIHSIL